MHNLDADTIQTAKKKKEKDIKVGFWQMLKFSDNEKKLVVYCANRDDLFDHSCLYHNTFVLCLYVCSFCVSCIGFIFCLLFVQTIPYKRHRK